MIECKKTNKNNEKVSRKGDISQHDYMDIKEIKTGQKHGVKR